MSTRRPAHNEAQELGDWLGSGYSGEVLRSQSYEHDAQFRPSTALGRYITEPSETLINLEAQCRAEAVRAGLAPGRALAVFGLRYTAAGRHIDTRITLNEMQRSDEYKANREFHDNSVTVNASIEAGRARAGTLAECVLTALTEAEKGVIERLYAERHLTRRHVAGTSGGYASPLRIPLLRAKSRGHDAQEEKFRAKVAKTASRIGSVSLQLSPLGLVSINGPQAS